MVLTIKDNFDLCDAKTDVVAHCANCFNTQKSGVAAALKKKYPQIEQIDSQTMKGDKNKLGTISFIQLNSLEKPKFGANLYGQYYYGTERRQVNYEAIYRALEELKGEMSDRSLTSVAFPYNMCSALAGGDFRIIDVMIKVVFEDTDFKIVYCKL